MLKRKRRILRLSLTLGVMSCLISCAQGNYDICPVYPVAGSRVAAELEKMSGSEFPNTWEWIGRIDKLRQELGVCE